jgi:Fe-S oxidoreductase
MARLKAEFLHQYYRKHGLPWRNWLFGNVAWLSSLGGRLGNAWMRSWLGRWVNDKLFGIDRRRLPPRLARQTFFDQFADRSFTAPPTVLLFVDTFTNLFEPHVGLAAMELFRRCGQSVLPGLPDVPPYPSGLRWEDWPWGLCCCGRPFISNGMLDKAVENARRNVERLYPWAAAGKVITACEPSCILTIKDDYPALLRGDERRQAETVAAACRTFEECLDPLMAAAPPFHPASGTILVQAHCHQRSLTGVSATLGLLRRVPGADVIDLDAGCCGLAGSFGYEKEHYEVSRLVGEQRLFPALRQAPAEAAVVASGFSCRLQVGHFTGRQALHPAAFLAKLATVSEPPAG